MIVSYKEVQNKECLSSLNDSNTEIMLPNTIRVIFYSSYLSPVLEAEKMANSSISAKVFILGMKYDGQKHWLLYQLNLLVLIGL